MTQETKINSVSNKPSVILTRKLPEDIETRMRELFNTTLNENDKPFSKVQLIDALNKAEVLVPTVTDKIDEELIKSSGENLKLIASFGTGVDHIDLKAAKKKGILVTNTPGVLTEDTADVVMSLILAVPRRIVEGDKKTRDGNWNGWSPTGMLGHRINGKRLGVVGMGRIGQAVARRAKGFGMSIHYHNRNKLHSEIEDSLEATWWQNLDQMISRMDIISINCPHTDQTHHMIGEKQLNLFQKHSYLVNAARGEIVDEKKLTDLLVSGNIAGAGLDVYENEPEIDKRLRKLNNVVLLPHIGSATIEGRVAMGEKVIINIKTVADGHTPPDLVLESMI
jgi:glyoxylate reductase